MRRGRMFHGVVLVFSALAAAVLAGSLCGPGIARANDLVVEPLVREHVARDGRARVLVSLRLAAGPHRPEGVLGSPSAVAGQRLDIAATQADIRSRLSGTQHDVIHAYESVPLLALSVDADALARLEAAGQVVDGIWLDGLNAPTLAQSVPLIEGDQAWAAGYDGTGTVVAIVDTGVDKSHPFLANKVVEEACYSSTGLSVSVCPNGQSQQFGAGAGVPCALISAGCWHGTHVAGIAAGNGDQAGQAFSGVAKGAHIMAVQVFSQFNDSANCGGAAPCILAWTSDIIAGLERVYSLRGQYNFASVNMSLGGGAYTSNCDTDPAKPIIDNLRSAGIATVVAAGNSAYRNALSSPACISTAVSVGSTTKGDVVSSFSNAASFMSVFAPGEAITSSSAGGGWRVASGTSMATPHVTGTFAVLRQAAPDATVGALVTALVETGVPIADTRSGGTVTKPRIRIFEAIQALDQGPSNPVPALTSLSPASATAGGAGIAITVNGSNFVASSVVRWNGVSRSTTYLGSGQLRAAISAGDLASAGSATVTVVSPAPGGGVSGGLTFTIAPRADFTLTVTKAGAGTGTISGATGINCGAACSANYQSGTQVTLHATPAAGSVFRGWTGACSGTGACTVTMNANKAVGATFDTKFTLSVTKAGAGSGTVSSFPAGIACGAKCSATYQSGKTITLIAMPAWTSRFAGWSGACSGTGSCKVTMTAARAVTATFARR